jgi:hypothetical protein
LEEKYGLNRAGECHRDERKQTFRSRVVNITGLRGIKWVNLRA